MKTLISFILIIALFAAVLIWRDINQNDLKKNGIVVQAKITRVNYGGKMGGGFNCIIIYNNLEIERPSPSSIKGGKSYFVGKSFPAMYSPKTQILEILITPRDFEKFNLAFPDSLNWVYEYIK